VDALGGADAAAGGVAELLLDAVEPGAGGVDEDLGVEGGFFAGGEVADLQGFDFAVCFVGGDDFGVVFDDGAVAGGVDQVFEAEAFGEADLGVVVRIRGV
jgi:hypothetical protein